MMTKQKSNSWAKSKVLIALPVLLILLFMLTARSFSSAVELSSSVQGLNPVHLIADAAPQPQDKQKQKTGTKVVPVDTTKKQPYLKVEKMPTFPGGQDALVKFLVANIQYPETAKQKKVQGKVFVCYIVRADGSVTNVKIQRGIGSGCDEEALRVAKLMPKWNPGEHNGKPVDVQFVLPIKFALN